jgi:hypothetical protein
MAEVLVAYLVLLVLMVALAVEVAGDNPLQEEQEIHQQLRQAKAIMEELLSLIIPRLQVMEAAVAERLVSGR